MTRKRNPDPGESARQKALYKKKWAGRADDAPMPYSCKGMASTAGRNKVYARLRAKLSDGDWMALMQAWGDAMWPIALTFVDRIPKVIPPPPTPVDLPVRLTHVDTVVPQLPPAASVQPTMTAEQIAAIVNQAVNTAVGHAMTNAAVVDRLAGAALAKMDAMTAPSTPVPQLPAAPAAQASLWSVRLAADPVISTDPNVPRPPDVPGRVFTVQADSAEEAEAKVKNGQDVDPRYKLRAKAARVEGFVT